MMLATFTIGSAALYTFLFLSKARDDAALTSNWFDMFERCRAAIETREPLQMFGLVAGGEIDPLRNAAATQTKMWTPLTGGRFAILEREDPGQGGAFRTCEVVPADWRVPLSRIEMERLTFIFLEQRNALIAKGTHEPRDPVVLPGIISAGFGPLANNPAGCRVVATIFADPKEHKLTSMVAEQPGSCSGASSLMTGTGVAASVAK